MRIFYPPDWLMILLFFVLWFVFQGGSALLCLKLPDRFLGKDGFLFKPHSFEKGGALYQKVFRIRRWKHLLPDGGALSGGYSKRHLSDMSRQNLSRFLLESRRAELVHWLGIAPFWVFGLFSPPEMILYMLVYALAVNLPCIIAQRYNRPRIQRLLERKGYESNAAAEQKKKAVQKNAPVVKLPKVAIASQESTLPVQNPFALGPSVASFTQSIEVQKELLPQVMLSQMQSTQMPHK